MFDFMTVARALTDENRVRILMALRDREMCVCQVTCFLDLSPSTTSKHLSILRQARLIQSRKKGKWVYYRLAADAACPAVVRGAIVWVMSNLGNSSLVREDSERIKAILKREQELCDGLGGDVENFHSLEIHSISDPEMDAAVEEES